MTDRELLEKVLAKVDNIEGKLQETSDIVKALCHRTEALDVKVDNIEGKLQETSDIVKALCHRTEALDVKVDNIEGKLQETSDIVKALCHRTEELDAKYDGLLNSTATKESISQMNNKLDRMAGDISYLVRKTVEHDDDIRELRRAK
jgi:hypothetical protein